jgi:hypothetical protein
MAPTEVCLVWIREQVGEKWSTVCPPKITNMLSNQKLKHVDDISLSELFGRIRLFFFLPVTLATRGVVWILRNLKDLLDYIQSRTLSSCNSIKTFDFSTLYTSIPHSKLRNRLRELVQLCSNIALFERTPM